jgi:6-phosphofructokinase 1
VSQQGYCVLVVAEGAGQELLSGADFGVDLSGNKRLAEIGPFLKQRINEHFNELGGAPASVKYVDPTYMVRAAAPNAADNVLCLQLAHDAVHGAFAGYTAFLSGRVNNRAVYIPAEFAAGRRNISPSGNFWQQLVFATGQPNW